MWVERDLRWECSRLCVLLCHSVTSELPLPSVVPLPRRILRDASAGAAKCDRIFLKCCSYPNIPLYKMFLNKTTCLFDGRAETPFQGVWMPGELLAALHLHLAMGRSSAGLSRYCQPENFVLKHCRTLLKLLECCWNSSNRKAKP